MIKGLIRKQISNQYTVIDLETKQEYLSIASGKLRHVKVDEKSSFNKTFGRNTKKNQQIIKISPKVGDKVVLNIENDQAIIDEILPRENDLVRPDVANVDQVLLVFSAIRPDFSFHLLDKFLVILNEQNLNITLLVSKIDLIAEADLEKLKVDLEYYKNKLNMDIYYVNSKQRVGFDVLQDIFKNKITVLAGQTGVGKSTLLNALIPSLALKTQEISDALGRGKHTTRHSELYDFNQGYICDTPGFSKIEINLYEKEVLKEYYPDFMDLSSDCKFSSCNHINEPGCAVKSALDHGLIPNERYENYVSFFNEIEAKKNKYWKENETMKIAPSVLTADFTNLENELKSIDQSDLIHIDIMDGNFVPNISFGPAITKQIASRTDIALDVHLMVVNPLDWIEQFALDEVKYITVHYESNDFEEALKTIKKLGKNVGITLKPETPLSVLKPYLSEVDLVLVMSVKPGFGGQKFIPEMLEKVKELKELRTVNDYKYLIEIDGGINDLTIIDAGNAGVDISVVGSYVFNQKDRNETIEKLKKCV